MMVFLPLLVDVMSRRLMRLTCMCPFRQRLFENLRMLPHAPGVQMQAIPEDAVQEDSGDEEEEDPNKRISSKLFVLGYDS